MFCHLHIRLYTHRYSTGNPIVSISRSVHRDKIMLHSSLGNSVILYEILHRIHEVDKSIALNSVFFTYEFRDFPELD